MQKLAIIVPYRDRAEHLKKFTVDIKNFLNDQGIGYHLFVIEQYGEDLFNRGKLLNIGFDLIKDDFDYVCFHDVDLIPGNSECDYSCPDGASHLSKYRSQSNYKVIWEPYFGGVNIFTKEAFKKINGFSNKFFGWGAEDDDLRKRCNFYKVPIERKNGRYLSLESIPNKIKKIKNPHYEINIKILTSIYDYSKDGLSTLSYELVKEDSFEYYKKYLVKI